MIRGVNKYIIEISDTGNEYFERAILFVRPESGDKEHDHLFRRAGEYLSQMKLRRRMYFRACLWQTVLKFTGAAAVGAGIAAMLLR